MGSRLYMQGGLPSAPCKLPADSRLERSTRPQPRITVQSIMQKRTPEKIGSPHFYMGM